MLTLEYQSDFNTRNAKDEHMERRMTLQAQFLQQVATAYGFRNLSEFLVKNRAAYDHACRVFSATYGS